MQRKLRYLALFLSILVPILNLAQEKIDTPRWVSFVELLANPTKFDGQLIFVTAFLGLDPPDGDMLYLHKEDYDHLILLNAVGIELSKQMWAEREKLDLNYVSVVGVFRSGGKSHNRYNMITNVTNCVLHSKQGDPKRGTINIPHKP